MTTKLNAIIAALVASIGFSASASAHIIIENMQGRAGYNELLTLMVPHGCGPAATTEVRLQVPEGMVIAVPEQKGGWETEVVMKTLDEPIMREGRPFTDVVSEMIWRGNLPSNQLGLFKFMVNLPNTPGEMIFFKTIQVCGDQEDRWIDTVASTAERWEVFLASQTPAPFIELIEAEPQLGITPQEMREKSKSMMEQ